MSNRSVNKITLLGNLTRDPELKYTPTGTAVCTFGVATNRSWVTQEGKTRDEVQFHRIVAWQKVAELCNKLLSKGKKVYIDGRITYREYVDKNGQQRNITEIVLDDFIVFYDTKPGDASEAQKDDSASDAGSPPSDEDESSEEKRKPKPKESVQDDEDVNPDDIPF
ncbi:MAG: single-stranded DNA-binding protein [Candidatus Roizmanbacteria bacterium]|nr:single-stranded DNA-binding protein [Candidatus Roizmanbacteria bacterium]